MQQETNDMKAGILFSIIAYVLWGILPIYWDLIHGFDAFEILAYRIILSMIFMLIVVSIGHYRRPFFEDVRFLFTTPTKLFALIIAGYVITLNWGTFIWAVTNGHVLQTSLGYYINPLVNIVLAFIFLKERFNKPEWLAIILALIGVLYMTIQVGVFPIVSLLLAFTFGLYGLIKKLVPIHAISSITIECIVTEPVALIYISYLFQQHESAVGLNMSTFLLLFSGALTAIPLILFSAGARRIPLSLMGFIQYIGPTIMFVLGIFVFGEPFDMNQFITFIFI
ncbi:chloramphenicol-sensitive protein RarD [Staphylococcus auricularis]|uniref:EamA family transporter RarD n=1 Tax=Staphylococcus auricularis TaxID=29379 RepID=A0AAP8TTV9_9STAP|nr:EamA family transporter RarD [Staphylococcus auricularis]QPT05316.1 EamA family transporter RarD [Staphylococcus auricularis]BCU52314.1 chloramphenicol-sensitive protein RarD [Staphylococcus auricularis]SQJ11692.1 rarD protein [Staphylococcus auricularis]